MSDSVGDTLLEFATLSLLRQFKIQYEIIDRNRLFETGTLPRHMTRLYIAGGGNMGSFYSECQALRFQACSFGLPITVLPQTFTDSDENSGVYDTIWVREKESLKICPSAKLAPDLAMSARLPARTEAIVKKTGVYFRQDVEALFPEHTSSYGDPAILARNLASYLELIAPFEHIITDRLYFAIAAMLMQRKVTLLPNAYYKNRSMWATWLGTRGCQWADHPDQIPVCHKIRVNRRIPRADDLYLGAKDLIKPVAGWTESERNERPVLEKKQGAHLPLDKKQQQLWRLLENTVSMESLRNSYLMKMDGEARDRNFDLNQRLRILFSCGAITIAPASNPKVVPEAGFLGGRDQVPIEVTLHSELELDNDVYVFADVLLKGALKTVWFRVKKTVKRFLNNSADPFLLCILQIAMRENKPLWIRGGFASTELLRNLQQFQRVWSLWHKEYNEIEIIVNQAPISYSDNNTGPETAIASFSGGVDSTFTLFNHTRNKRNRYKHKLTHAMLAHGFDIPLYDQATFDKVQQQCEIMANDVGVQLLTVATNIRDLDFDWEQGHVSVIASCMHLLSNGFKTGLVPSTLNYGVLYPWGSTPLTEPMHSSYKMRIETDGADYTRVDKVRMLNGWKVGIENLRFCYIAEPSDHNCGHCGKCTMTAIMILVAKASKKSIQPFPQSKRIEAQLERFSLSRLDRSDFRNDLFTLKKIRHKPGWLHKLLSKLETEDL